MMKSSAVMGYDRLLKELNTWNSMNQVIENPKKLSESLRHNSYLLPYLAAFLAFLAPIGYLIGLGYQAGYLGAFGVSTSAFPMSLTDGYIYGYYSVLFYIIDFFEVLTESDLWISILKTISIIFMVMFFFVKAIRYGHPDSEKYIPLPETIRNRFSYFHPSNNDFSATLVLFAKMLSVFSAVVYIAIIFLLLWVLITVLSFQKGALHASTTKNDYVNNQCALNPNSKLSECVSIIDTSGKTVIEGLLIALHEKRYAVFTENGPIISELPDGAKIVKHFDKKAYIESGFTKE